MRPLEAYHAELERPGFERDPAQRIAIGALDEIFRELNREDSGWWPSLRGRLGLKRKIRPVRGLYLWGDVGRGKTFLMDLFYNCLPPGIRRRSHFHRFMLSIHARLRELDDQRDPLPSIAAEIARDVRVLCFDELFVSDIGDAMLLGGLLNALFAEGVTLIATSNSPPARLYDGGLQRERFLPAIAALEQHCEVIRLESGVDYRLRVLKRAEIYHAPLDSAAERNLQKYFEAIAPDAGKRDHSLLIEGRPVRARRVADGILWCDFAQLCEGPRGAADYVEIAREFHTVLLSRVPVLDRNLENEARRFIALVDELYDRNVTLIVSAAVPLPDLYVGKRLAFEFRRTRSRLEEMQSHEYLARPHLP